MILPGFGAFFAPPSLPSERFRASQASSARPSPRFRTRKARSRQRREQPRPEDEHGPPVTPETFTQFLTNPSALRSGFPKWNLEKMAGRSVGPTPAQSTVAATEGLLVLGRPRTSALRRRRLPAAPPVGSAPRRPFGSSVPSITHIPDS